MVIGYGLLSGMVNLICNEIYKLTKTYRMMPEDNVYGTWPASGEIDLMEAKGNDGQG